MVWELYEIWAKRETGHEELYETTASLIEARAFSKRAIKEDEYVEATIIRELEDGDQEFVESLTKSE